MEASSSNAPPSTPPSALPSTDPTSECALKAQPDSHIPKRVLKGADRHLKRLSKMLKKLARSIPDSHSDETLTSQRELTESMLSEFGHLVQHLDLERKRADLEFLILKETIFLMLILF